MDSRGARILGIVYIALNWLALVPFFLAATGMVTGANSLFIFGVVGLACIGLILTGLRVFLRHEDWAGVMAYVRDVRLFNRKVVAAFDMLPGEQVLFPIKPCYWRIVSATTRTANVNGIIVTNLRILIGLHRSFSGEVFGLLNLWHPDLTTIPETRDASSLLGSLAGLSGGNDRMGDISFAQDSKLGDAIVMSRPWLFSKATVTIYHPEARKIVEWFQKPLVWQQPAAVTAPLPAGPVVPHKPFSTLATVCLCLALLPLLLSILAPIVSTFAGAGDFGLTLAAGADLFLPPFAVLLSIIAIVHIRRRRQDGIGLAIAALVISALTVAMLVIFLHGQA